MLKSHRGSFGSAYQAYLHFERLKSPSRNSNLSALRNPDHRDSGNTYRLHVRAEQALQIEQKKFPPWLW